MLATAMMRKAVRGIGGAVGELFPRVTDVEPTGEPLVEWVPDPATAYCGRCGADCGPGASDASGCAFCRDVRIAWDGLTRLSAYREPLDARIREMKFARQWRWATWLGERLAASLPASLPRDAVVVAVPMPFVRRWSRGFNQSALMADELARRRGWRRVDALVRSEYRRPQTALRNFSDRQSNAANSFAALPVDLAGATAVLVDDVKTSGATLTQCARLLRKLSAARVHVAVAAVADRHDADFQRIDA